MSAAPEWLAATEVLILIAEGRTSCDQVGIGQQKDEARLHRSAPRRLARRTTFPNDTHRAMPLPVTPGMANSSLRMGA